MPRRTTTPDTAPATDATNLPAPIVLAESDGTMLIGDGTIELTERMLTARPGALLECDTWGGVGAYLDIVHGASQWWLGDWLILGEARFGESHAQYLPSVGVTGETLSQYAWVARNIPPDRRIYALSWSVYREVADLPPDQQSLWLSRAEVGTDGVKWSAAELRRRMKEAAGDEVPEEPWVLVKCTDDRDQRAFLEQMERGGRTARATTRRAAP